MTTNTDHLMAVLNRWITSSNLTGTTARKVTALIDDACQDTGFRYDLDAVLAADSPPDQTAETLRNLAGDWYARRAGSDRDSAARLFTDAVVAAARVENSSLGTRGAQRLRDQVSVRDVTQFQTACRHLNEPESGFWGALSVAEKDDFMARARQRTFARGTCLMREGETGDYVVVIQTGWVKICVDDRGQERIIAKRGPGELIGERAAFQRSTRSATVIALDTVRVLTMHTGDFAAFLGAHPAVLGIVESQVYSRIAEKPASDLGDDVPASGWSPAGENCTVIVTDVVAYGAPNGSDTDRLHIRRALMNMTSAALKAIWSECVWEDRGDALLIVVPPAVPTRQVLEYLLVPLPIALRRHNAACGHGSRFQLRVALDVGAVTGDGMGVSGRVLNNAARLLDAPALKKAINASGAQLGMIVSDFVYQDTVRQAQHATDPHAWTKVQLRIKETSMRAWTHQDSGAASPIPAGSKLELIAGPAQESSRSSERAGDPLAPGQGQCRCRVHTHPQPYFPQ